MGEVDLVAEKPSEQGQDDYKKVEEQWNRYVRARDSGHRDYVERAKKCDRFYRGEQWDEADLMKLKAQGRPALTINTILPTINMVLGEQAAKRASFMYRIRRNGNPATSNALSKLSMQILENNNFNYKESEVFADGLIEERGYFDVRMRFDDHMLGEASIEVLDPKDTIPDPDGREYDPRTWKEVFNTRWMSLDEIKYHYGEKAAKKVQASVSSGQNFGVDSIRFDEGRDAFFGDTESGYWDEALALSAEEARSIRKVRVIERQFYQFVPCWYFVNMVTGDLRQVPTTWDDARMKDFAQRNGLGLTTQVNRKVRWRVTADRVLLHDGWSPYRTFTIIPYFCYFRRGKPFGMVTNLISPQEQLNKISSQELHIVNTTANSGWMFESGSLVGMTADDLVERGAETGLVLEYAPGRNAPDKIQPNSIPTGLDRVALKSQDNIRVISGVSEALLGMDSPEVSGVALENKERRGQVQIQKPLDNLARTRQLVGDKILELIQQFYTEQRIVQITNEWQPGAPTEEMVINQATASGEILNDLTMGEYKTVVSTIPAHETFDDLMFAETLQLRNAGVNIPDHHVVKHSHLPNRDELSVEIAELNGFGEPTEQEAQIAAIQQELQLRAMQAEVEKLEMEVGELESQIQLNLAKAEDLTQQAQLETAKMIMELEKKRTEMGMRKQLAELSSQTQLAKQKMSGETKLVGEAMNRFAQRISGKPDGNKET